MLHIEHENQSYLFKGNILLKKYPFWVKICIINSKLFTLYKNPEEIFWKKNRIVISEIQKIRSVTVQILQTTNNSNCTEQGGKFKINLFCLLFNVHCSIAALMNMIGQIKSYDINYNFKHLDIPRIDFQSSHSSWLLIYVRDDPLGHLLWGEDDKGEGEEDEDEEGEGKEA